MCSSTCTVLKQSITLKFYIMKPVYGNLRVVSPDNIFASKSNKFSITFKLYVLKIVRMKEKNL